MEKPTLLAYDRGNGQWMAWCDRCGRFHYHSAGEGHRTAHCQKDEGYWDTGYILKYTGLKAPNIENSTFVPDSEEVDYEVRLPSGPEGEYNWHPVMKKT
jgi:hypothetical protein